MTIAAILARAARVLESPRGDKQPAETKNQRPITETDRGQYLEIANWIRGSNIESVLSEVLKSEKILDKFVRYIPKTRDNNIVATDQTVDELKEQLFKEGGRESQEMLWMSSINGRWHSNKELPNRLRLRYKNGRTVLHFRRLGAEASVQTP